MLKLETTYITMSTQKTISIHNRSNIVVHYQWKKYATLSEERNTKDMLVNFVYFVVKGEILELSGLHFQ